MKFEDTNTQPATILKQFDYAYTGLAVTYYHTETNANCVKHTPLMTTPCS